MFRVIKIVLCACLVVSCAGTFGPSFIQTADYTFSLDSVERPEDAKDRYGDIAIEKISEEGKTKYSFEDDFVKIVWFVDVENIAFIMNNKMDNSIKIVWDEAVYVDEVGVSHPVIHAGIKYVDKGNSKPPSTIIRKGMIEDLVYPADYIALSSSMWMTQDLFPHSRDAGGIWTVSSGFFGQRNVTDEEWREKVIKNKGKTFQVLLPLQIQNVVNEYIFIFKITDVVPNLPPAPVEKK